MITNSLSKPPQKHYIPSRKLEAKAAMTVVVGFRCKEGIVICADRQVSSVGSFKYEEQKITKLESAGESIVFAYSGLPSLAGEARDKILAKCSDRSNEIVYEAADAVLTEMRRLYTDLNLQFLIGTVVLNQEPDLIKFDGKGLHVADDYNFLGVGNSGLLRFLAETMYSPQMNVKDAINLAIYCVQKAEDHIDECGGLIDVSILTRGNERCESLSPESIQDRIKQMEKQEALLTDLIIRKPFSSLPT